VIGQTISHYRILQKLDQITNKALEKDRKLRYQSASEVGVDLKRLKREVDSGRTGITSTGASGEMAASPPLPPCSQSPSFWRISSVQLCPRQESRATRRSPTMAGRRILLDKTTPTVLTDGRGCTFRRMSMGALSSPRSPRQVAIRRGTSGNSLVSNPCLSRFRSRA
jgi:hypothetical protein